MDIKVINNSIDAYPWEDIVNKESAQADLTILGVSKISQGHFEKIYNQINLLKQNLGFLLLIKASPHFEKISLGIDDAQKETQFNLESEVELPEPGAVTISQG